MPVQGFTRFREHQFGRQFSFGTKVAATRAYPYQGVPSNELNWTDPEIDAGSYDLVAPPYRGPADLTADLTAPVVNYNDLPQMLSAIFGGQVEPTLSGSAYTWLFEPESIEVADLDLYTYEFGDDVLTDWFQLGDGLLETLTITAPEGLGPLEASMSWRFGSFASTGSTDSPVTGTVPTPALTVDTAAVPIYGKDLGIYIASSVAGLGAGQITDALHNFELSITWETDLKRWMNRDKSFDIDAYGRGARLIELTARYAKTADTVGTGSESDAWTSDTAVNRFIRISAESAETISTGPDVFYAWDWTMPARYYTREETEIGGNTTIDLMARAFYEPDDLGNVVETTIVNTLPGDELGNVAS